MRAVFLFSLLVVLLTSSDKVWSENKYRYLIDTTNKIMELNSQSSIQSAETLASVASQACYTLKQLLEDKEFRNDLNKMMEAKGKYKKELAELRRDLSLFVEAFLRTEEKSLKEAGLSEEAAKQILWSASLFRGAVEDNINIERVLSGIDKLRQDVCAGEKTILSIRDSKRRQETFVTWAYRIGGITLIVVDVSVSVPSGGVAAASTAIGTAVAGWK